MKRFPDRFRDTLAGKTLAMIFHRPSIRARVSFEVGVYQLGGLGLYLSGDDLGLGRDETIPNVGRVLSRYAGAIMAGGYDHAEMVELSKSASVPVINGLSDLLDPCQALADYFTLKGKKIAYVGDGNSICHSLLYGANKVGIHIAVATPLGYEPKSIIMKSVLREASQVGVTVSSSSDAVEAVVGADAVYTDVWVPPGQEADAERRREAFRPYQVNATLMAKAKPDAVFMHRLPARPEEEVSTEVLDGQQSIVLDQVESRLHVQKALVHLLMATAT
jgi:ornithine carbamoyltransferase